MDAFNNFVMKYGLIALLIVGVLVFCYYKFLRPAAIHHDSTCCFTGGLGSGKTLNAVKTCKRFYRHAHRSWAFRYFWLNLKVKFAITSDAKEMNQLDADAWLLKEPRFYSNMPVRLRRNKFCCILDKSHMDFKRRIPEGSVVFIDEFPQFLSQFDFKLPGVQSHQNEFSTYFRHYIDGLLCITAQSLDEVECHYRRKLNSYYHCFDFQKILGIFYRVRVIRMAVADMSVSMTSEFLDENAKWHYGVLLFRHYDPRCYSKRYDKVTDLSFEEFDDFKTNRILRYDDSRISPLDDVVDVKEAK